MKTVKEVMTAHPVSVTLTPGKQLTGVVSLGDLAVQRIFADEAAEALSEISQRPLH
ncbi:hypothetical protein [Paenibacillus piscarius]|uniref:hypothetical protein n=1 Tax=Paenibacillus piscarius TaxID=1089681 RepID=UPI001EE8C00E|nr:hypothetical protein [Paenibacillus piscarius]